MLFEPGGACGDRGGRGSAGAPPGRTRKRSRPAPPATLPSPLRARSCSRVQSGVETRGGLLTKQAQRIRPYGAGRGRIASGCGRAPASRGPAADSRPRRVARDSPPRPLECDHRRRGRARRPQDPRRGRLDSHGRDGDPPGRRQPLSAEVSGRRLCRQRIRQGGRISPGRRARQPRDADRADQHARRRHRGRRGREAGRWLSRATRRSAPSTRSWGRRTTDGT